MQLPSGVEIMPKTIDNTSIGVSQQLFNINSTTLQQPDPVEHSENGHKPCQTGDIASNKISQQLPEKKGEREGVESVPPNGVLQTPVGGEQGEGDRIVPTILWRLSLSLPTAIVNSC
jgi:hypothetical protein